MRELEAANFDLEEQLVRCSSAEREESERKRAYTIMESSLIEKEEVCVIERDSLCLATMGAEIEQRRHLE